MNTLAEIAVAKFTEGYNCSQSVLYACHGKLGLDPGVSLKLACGFGAGIGRCQEVCGALSGGIMALGLRYGRGEGEDTDRTDDTYAKTQKLMDAFKERHGSVLCRELMHGCDLRSEEGRREYTARGLKTTTCVPCIRTVAEAVDGLL